ncbi:MAG: polysaccharide biosynthesis protein [Ruminococcaceae bacterium]|nr:polysaccharide biosynthesis protein [Oscillospiraceae bacterium]
MKKTLFIKNALILTATSLLLRLFGIIFKVWLAQEIGSEGIGLYQLVFSVYVLASTFAMSGTSTAVTRLVSEELAFSDKKSALKILKRAIQISLVFAIATVVLLFFGAKFIGTTILGDPRTIPALKILPLSIPFIGITSCLRGYFIARRKASPNALGQIFEQIIRIVVIFWLVSNFKQDGLAKCCFAVVLGDAAAEILSCFLLFLFFWKDKKKLSALSQNSLRKLPIIRRILHISLPITSSRYLNSLLRTAENILVPKNLAKYPYSSQSALSQFGMIKGMVLPILFFPSAILNAVSTLLIPEISESVALGQKNVVKNSCERIFKITTLIGIPFFAIFFIAGGEIGLLIYNDPSVGFLLKALSPIVPLMYLDSICDGILKGMDQQAFSFKTCISDSVIRLILILLILPKTGLMGFIVIMYFSNLFTCLLNTRRLQKISGAKMNILKNIIIPILTALICALLSRVLFSQLCSVSLLGYCITFCVFTCGVYILILWLLKIVKKEDFLR